MTAFAGVPSMFPDQYSADLVPFTTGSGQQAASQVAFGFQATRIKVCNDRATAVFVSFSTSASTGGFRTCSGEQFEFAVPPCSGVSLASTSPSTGTIVRVSAV